MNSLGEFTLKSLNRIHQKVLPSSSFIVTDSLADYSGQAASDVIKEQLQKPAATMICRFGMVEFYCLLTHYFIKQKAPYFKKLTNYVRGKSFPFWWDTAIFREMTKNAGFINPSKSSLEKFCELMEADMAFVDVLGSWVKGEELFEDKMPGVVKVRIWDLEPYKHANPWSQVLENKTVLVIHPFEESIQNQFKKRALLFKDQRVLPAFELKTIKAVQSIAYNQTGFKDWFEALDYMKEKITNTSFDIAIIGCGAYGFPLAAHVKRMGKKAIHLGGATQVLFGIKGKRWEADGYYVNSLFNQHWIRPTVQEVPQNHSKIEGGCYW